MKRVRRIVFLALLVVMTASFALAEGDLTFYNLGDFRLENGQTIRECRVGYRTFGTLNTEKSNVLLFPTWLAGTSGDLADIGLVGPGKLADTSRYFVVAVDAFGNGVSSSPSTSALQSGTAFPAFTIRDMVEAQYLLLTRALRLTRLHGVVGISMGGMQAFQWMVSYPDFVERAVPISGTPRLTSYDQLFWRGELQIIDAVRNSPPGANAPMRALAPVHVLNSRTPEYFTRTVKSGDVSGFLASAEKSFVKFDAHNWASQLKAIMGHDIFRSFDGSEAAAARSTKVRTLIIVASGDRMVYSGPSRSFALLLKSAFWEFKGDCGHFSFLCEAAELRGLVWTFLDK
jgi:homoserine O-acetyltransferase/O-succinyltransferase